jgi:hypothetical protein
MHGERRPRQRQVDKRQRAGALLGEHSPSRTCRLSGHQHNKMSTNWHVVSLVNPYKHRRLRRFATFLSRRGGTRERTARARDGRPRQAVRTPQVACASGPSRTVRRRRKESIGLVDRPQSRLLFPARLGRGLPRSGGSRRPGAPPPAQVRRVQGPSPGWPPGKLSRKQGAPACRHRSGRSSRVPRTASRLNPGQVVRGRPRTGTACAGLTARSGTACWARGSRAAGGAGGRCPAGRR